MRRMSRAQYAAIVARQRQISQQNKSDQSGNELDNTLQNNTQENEVITTVEKRVTFQDNNLQRTKENELQRQLNEKVKLQQQQEEQRKKQELLRNREQQQKMQQDLQKQKMPTNADFGQLQKTLEGNYAIVIKKFEDIIDVHKNEKERMVKQIETMNNRHDFKIKQYEETITTLNNTVKNLTEMLNSKFLELATTQQSKIYESKESSTDDLPEEPKIKVNLNVIEDSIDVKLEVTDDAASNEKSTSDTEINDISNN